MGPGNRLRYQPVRSLRDMCWWFWLGRGVPEHFLEARYCKAKVGWWWSNFWHFENFEFFGHFSPTHQWFGRHFPNKIRHVGRFFDCWFNVRRWCVIVFFGSFVCAVPLVIELATFPSMNPSLQVLAREPWLNGPPRACTYWPMFAWWCGLLSPRRFCIHYIFGFL